MAPRNRKSDKKTDVLLKSKEFVNKNRFLILPGKSFMFYLF